MKAQNKTIEEEVKVLCELIINSIDKSSYIYPRDGHAIAIDQKGREQKNAVKYNKKPTESIHFVWHYVADAWYIVEKLYQSIEATKFTLLKTSTNKEEAVFIYFKDELLCQIEYDSNTLHIWFPTDESTYKLSKIQTMFVKELKTLCNIDDGDMYDPCVLNSYTE